MGGGSANAPVSRSRSRTGVLRRLGSCRSASCKRPSSWSQMPVSFNRVGISLRRSGVARIRSSQNRFVLAERPQQARGRRCDRRRCEVAAIAWSEASQAFKVRRVDAATPATGTDRTSDHLNRIVKDYRIDLGAPLILKRIRDEMVPVRLGPIASQRPASFKPGHKKLGGRKKGTP